MLSQAIRSAQKCCKNAKCHFRDPNFRTVQGLRIPPGEGRHFKNSPLVLLLLATPLPRCTPQPVAVIASLMPYLDFIGRSFKTWLQTPTQGRFIFRCNCWENFSIHYMYAGLATSIRKTYRLVQRKYFNFCEMSGFVHANGSPCPANEWTSCLFEALLAESINHASIKVYLSEIRAQYVLQNNILISYYCQTNTAFIYLRWTN